SATSPWGPPWSRAGSASPAPPPGSPPCAVRSRGAELPLLRFLERLAVDAERGHRARLQPLDADVRPAVLALAVRAVLDAPECLVDLRDELAIAVADAEEEVAVAFERGAIGRVGELLAVLPHAVDGAGGFVDQFVAPRLEERAERIEFALSHGELRGDRCSTGAGRTQSARRAGVRIAYLDAFSGVSGDMTVGALLDLGLPLAALREAIAALALPGVEVAVERVARSGIAAAKFHVRCPDQGPPALGARPAAGTGPGGGPAGRRPPGRTRGRCGRAGHADRRRHRRGARAARGRARDAHRGRRLRRR